MPNDQEFLGRVSDLLAKHYSQRTFGVLQLAIQLGISDRHLQRKLNALTGRSPAQYLRDYRLSTALGLLEAGRSVGAVADAVGFASHAYFTTCFKTKFGTTPSRFQAGCRLAGQNLSLSRKDRADFR